MQTCNSCFKVIIYSDSDTPMSCLAQEAPRTPVALRLHRDNLTMELLWLQQAIGSRKKVRRRKGE